MATYVVYVARGREGKASEAFVVSNTLSAETAKKAFKKKYPRDRIKTILKAKSIIHRDY